jgi:hypothetical protein
VAEDADSRRSSTTSSALLYAQEENDRLTELPNKFQSSSFQFQLRKQTGKPLPP